ncbi:hypothetical protein H9W91_17495 [Streptomyces alfalfae]|uniref:DUF6907 domain-containing protein n=1 Tax=Streptomyces alfalfae TaxID=1642299 RepID=UPI001BA90BBB|nr:hypothetical protein [Streptomyces alfalfae]QUI32456.1 hypothetical protein H9W91_17495 [Streptomyces alfalfae]
MTENLPVYGPTTVFPADQDTRGDVIVRVAFTLSRTQLATALSVACATTGHDAAHMAVDEIRTEIEGYLAATGVVQADEDARQAPEQALTAAIARAYPPPPAPAALQSPLYRDGTVVLQTLDHGDVTVIEPHWCTGHDDDTVGRLADITHDGPHVRAGASTSRHGYVDIMDACISHAPFGDQPEPDPVLSLRVDVEMDATPEDARKVAQGLRVASLRLDRTADEVERLRGGGQ